MALTFEKRNEKPWRFILSMAFLCMLSGFGIVLAGGVATAWVLEICMEKKWRFYEVTFWKDQRVLALLTLLALAGILILQIMPYSNTFAMSIQASNPLWLCLLYSFFVMIPDSTLLNVLECEGMPKYSPMNTAQFGLAVIICIVILIVFYFYSTKKNQLYFWIPYVFYSVFTSIVYFSAHHLCIIVAFVVFWLWIASLDDDRGKRFQRIWKGVKLSEHDAASLRILGIVLGMLLLLVPVAWTVMASIHEIEQDYFNSKGTATFIKQHGLDNASFLVEWGEVIDDEWTEEEFFEKVNAYGLDVSINPVSVMPYFDHNFCLNLNGGADDKAYNVHRFATAEESREVFRELKEQGAPDVIIGLIDLERIYGNEISMKDYVPVYKISPRYVSVWKHFKTFGDSFKSRYMYLRKDLLDQYGVTRIYD